MSKQSNYNENTEVNYVEAKKDFLMLASSFANHPKYSEVYRFYKQDSIEKMIDLRLKNAGLARHEKYEVININGTNRLVEQRKWPWIHAQCLSWEEIFDLFMPLHVESGHRDPQYLSKQIRLMMTNLRVEYKYPWIALPLFHKACTICALNNKKLHPVKVCSVHAIAVPQRKHDHKFRYLLIYYDLETHFTILRPLIERSHREISTELYKIFMQFGPPNTIIMHGYNPKLSENVEKLLKEICPTFRVLVRHRPVKYELPTIVSDRIDAWLERTKKTQWEIGCFIVQAELNNSHIVKPELKNLKTTPYDLQFHTKEYDKTLLKIDEDSYQHNVMKKQQKDSETKTIKKASKTVDEIQTEMAKMGQSSTNESNNCAGPSKRSFLDAYLTQIKTRDDS